MAFSACPLTAFADDSVYTGGLCEHHTEHNEECGYVPAKEGSPCGYWCEICSGETEESDKADATDETDETEEPECECDTLCTEDEVNEDCPVCSEDWENCEGEESEKSFSPMSERAIEPKEPGGKGTEGSPYEITSKEELYWFAGLVNGTLEGERQNTAACAILTEDITLNKDVLNADGNLNSGTFTEWTPIGSKNNPYTGTFDGNEKTISGLYIDSEDRLVGLFGYIGNGATVKNVGIVDSYINFSGDYAGGGVCGYNYGGTITNCYNTGTVSGTSASSINYVGGICGQNMNNGKIENCYNTGIVSSSGFFAGGVCGYNDEGEISNCYNTGNVSGSYVAGGVCGISSGTVENCYNTGTVSGEYAGGVCGYNMNNGTIENCYNTGNVSGRNAGGVCGYNSNNGTIENCYNTGTVSGEYAGGVCGYNRSTVENCYNTVIVSGTYAGGVCGWNLGGTVENCYYLEGLAETGVGSGSGTLTDIEEKSRSQFSSGEVAWLLQNGQEEQVWGQKIGVDSYPKFSDSENEKVLKAAFMNSDAEIQVAYANYNTALTEPEFVVAEDEKIDGWYENGDFSGNAWNFENGIVQDITLYVKISKIQYNVTLKADGDGAVSGGGIYVHGTEVTVTADPDSGFRFVRWEENGTEVSDEAEYTFIIKGDRELTAVFERRSSGGSYSLPEGIDRDEPKDEPEEEPEVEPDTPGTDIFTDFSDVPAEAWYSEAVDYATENGIMNGVGGNRFEPETELKREMLAVILWNMTDNPEPNGIAPFLDVTSDKYYAKAIAWANENGVMYGYGEEFGVGEAVTREDFAAILYRYAAFKGYDTTKGGMAIREFIDFDQIADYAVEALGWAVNSGIISGMGDGTVSPKTSTYRGQAAVMLMKFCENIMK